MTSDDSFPIDIGIATDIGVNDSLTTLTNLSDPPQFGKVAINLNRSCNLRCTYCFLDKVPIQMTEETANSIIRQLPSLGTKEIHFFGTEPLMSYDRLKQITEGTNFPAGMTTNGTLVTRGKAKWIADNLERGVLLSCDGVEQACSQRRTIKGEPAFRQIIRGWDLLVDAGVTPAIAATVTPENLDWLVRSAKFLLMRPQNFVHFNFDTTYGKWSRRLLREKLIELADWYYGEYKPNGQGKIRNFHRDFDKTKASRVTCGACQNSVGIDWDGTIRGCHRNNMPSIGRVHDSEVILDIPLIDEFKQHNYRRCNECPANPCSTCYSNFIDVTGDWRKFNDEWCKVQLIKWEVKEYVKKVYGRRT